MKIDYRSKYIPTGQDIKNLGITNGHVKSWLINHPHEGRNLARAIALLNNGYVPDDDRLADWLVSVTHDCIGKCPMDLLEDIKNNTPIDGPIEVSDSDRESWESRIHRLNK